MGERRCFVDRRWVSEALKNWPQLEYIMWLYIYFYEHTEIIIIAYDDKNIWNIFLSKN